MTAASLGRRILKFHDEICRVCGQLDRICLAIYEPQTDVLKTFVASSDRVWPLKCYEACLSEVPSLQVLSQSLETRIIDDLRVLGGSHTAHTQALLKAGFRSSYTVPLTRNGQFIGFLFFDSKRPGYFTASVRRYLDPYVTLLAGLVLSQLYSVKSLGKAIREAFLVTGEGERDAHQVRVAQYARIIGREIAALSGTSEEFVEYLYQFAPLHDIGNLAISQRLLNKPAKLSPEEYRVVQSHVAKGREIAQVMLRRFQLEELPFVPVLLNLIMTHHERYDGSGYPRGLVGGDIPLEGRIVAVADVFDALTSDRPHRPARSTAFARAYLLEHRGILFDPDCVDALMKRWDACVEVRAHFPDSGAGQTA